jgi:mannose-6-phosphate isomerase-like protein (cupin superfamily)
MKKGKLWGETEALLQTPLAELHRIRAEPFSRCSWHVHQRKHNAFYVLEGKLVIQIRSGDAVDETVLRPGEMLTVAPGVKHRFATAAEPALALELYYLEPLSEDIVRDDVGGRYGAFGAYSSDPPLGTSE